MLGARNDHRGLRPFQKNRLLSLLSWSNLRTMLAGQLYLDVPSHLFLANAGLNSKCISSRQVTLTTMINVETFNI